MAISSITKPAVSLLLKPVVSLVHQQWKRRNSDTVEVTALTSVRSEISEAVSVITQDVETLHGYAWTWIKGVLSDPPAALDDQIVKSWLKTEGAQDALALAVDALVQGQDLEESIAHAGAHFHRITDQQPWYGEAIALSVLGFVSSSLQSKLTTGDRLLAGIINAHATRTTQQFVDMAQDMRRILDRLDERNGQFLSEASFLPLPIQAPQGIDIGRRPRRADLRSGRFKDRPGPLQIVTDALLSWLITADESNLILGKLPVFWIDGRPGDGKSVLLLQTVASLVLAGELPSITELATGSEVEAWLGSRERGHSAAARRHWDIAFVDDLYRKFEDQDLRDLISRSYHAGSPICALITTGPTIERQEAARNPRLAITSVSVPHLDLGEMNEFKSWIEAASGEQRGMPEIAGDRVLVEWLLEMASGKLDDDFADNLAATMKRLQIMEIALITAAVNALDIAAPKALLRSAAARTGFAALQTEAGEHLQLRLDEDQAGIYLLHPALVWPLFKLWIRKEDTTLAWGNALGRAVSHFLRSGEYTNARSLVGKILRGEVVKRLFATQDKEASRAIAMTVLEAIHEVVSDECKLSDRVRLTDLWISAATSDRMAYPGLHQLVEEAITAHNDEALSLDDKADLSATLLFFAHRGISQGSKEFASEFLGRSPRASQVSALERLTRRPPKGIRLAFVIQWLSSNTAAPEAGPIFSKMVETVELPKVLDLAFAYMRQNPDAHEAAKVMWSITMAGEADERFYPTLAAWIAVTNDTEVLGRIVERLLLSTGWLHPPHLMKKAYDSFRYGDSAVVLRGGLIRFLDRTRGSMPAAQVLASMIRHREIQGPWLERAHAHVRETSGSIRNHVLSMLVRFAPTLETLKIAAGVISEMTDVKRRERFAEQARNGIADLEEGVRTEILADLDDCELATLAGPLSPESSWSREL